jgi:hypothetical protein
MMNGEIGDPKASVDETAIDDNEIETEADIGDGTTVVLDETGVLTDNVGDVSVAKMRMPIARKKFGSASRKWRKKSPSRIPTRST